jgi:hypothetical protein
MSEELDKGGDDRAAKIVVGLMTIGVMLAMGAVHTFMKYSGSNTISMKMERPRPSASVDVGVCLVTSEPAGAVVYALRADGREALGVTPVEIGQGDYEIRLELRGYASDRAAVGVHDAACTLHRKLRADP